MVMSFFVPSIAIFMGDTFWDKDFFSFEADLDLHLFLVGVCPVMADSQTLLGAWLVELGSVLLTPSPMA